MKKLLALTVVLIGGGVCLPTAAFAKEEKETPMLPGLPWRVHDAKRPVPRVVTPGETFSHGAPPPADAIVLFDGTDLSKWRSNKGPARWKVENGYMEVVKDSGNIFSIEEFADCQLHLEFATPARVDDKSQGRGNSGVFLFGGFEVQVLDSYQNWTYPDGQCGALYGQWPPLVNPVKKPGEWQSYDIIFEAPRWDDSGKLIKRAAVTVLLNGVLIHHRKEFMGETCHAELARYGKPRTRGPIMLQDHGNPVRFRNIWVRPLGDYDQP
ncbi:MAG: DUF1080 domain-containing protein [Verrucomicrobiales bacterium]|nr:DUF1080 domain-containing protein [Verrucomicrobiales bacterium]